MIIGLLLTILALGIFTHVFDNREPAGHFDIYSNSKHADSSVQSALYYKGHQLTGRVNSYSLDPNNPDRILFSSDDIFHGSEGLCGTFLYDGQSRQLTRLRRWPYGGRLWSPDSRFILLDRATIRELSTGEEVDLTDSFSRLDGDRVELSVLEWSPDSQRLAAVVTIAPDGRILDRDLVEISLVPLRVKYVATIIDSSLVWREEDISWMGGELHVAAPSTPERKIIVKSREVRGWITNPPSVPPKPVLHEQYCSIAEDKPK